MVRVENIFDSRKLLKDFWGHLSSLRRVLRKQWCGISFRKSPRPSLPLKRAPPLTPTLSPQERGRKPPYSVLTFLPLRLSCKESSTSNQAFLLRRKDVTALLGARNRYALRLADHQRSSPCCAGWDRREKESLQFIVNSLQFIVYRL